MRLFPWIIILSLLFSSSSSAFDLANAPVGFEDFKIDLFDENSQVTGAIIFDLDVMNNDQIPTYVAADGSSCGATVNYDIYRWLDIDLPHAGITIPIPVKFVKNCVDNVIAYSADY